MIKIIKKVREPIPPEYDKRYNDSMAAARKVMKEQRKLRKEIEQRRKEERIKNEENIMDKDNIKNE